MICSKWILSADPGRTGSAALLHVLDGTVSLVLVLSFGLKKNQDDWQQKIRDWCFLYQPDFIVMEDVHAFGRDTRRNAFAFGGNKEKVLSALKFARRKVDKTYDPKTWQRLCALPHNYHIRDDVARRKENRKCQKRLAIKLFPQLALEKGDVYASVLIGYAAAIEQQASEAPVYPTNQ